MTVQNAIATQRITQDGSALGIHLILDVRAKYGGRLDFLLGSVVKNPPANAGDMGLIPGRGRFHMPRGN